jgi:hypothetical protein
MTSENSSKKSSSDKPGFLQRIKPGNLVLWLLVIVSIMLNVVVLIQLLSFRRAAHAAVTEASAVLADLQDETIALTIPVDETIVIDTEFPVTETVSVPIQTEVPISAAVAVMVDAGLLGGIPVSFPISANVPVDVMVDVPIDQTFAVQAPITLELEIPIEIAMADTPLAETLSQVQESLTSLAAELETSPLRLK